METAIELIKKYYAGTKNVLEWITTLEKSTTGLRLLAEMKEVPALGNAVSESRHDNVDNGDVGGV